MSTILSIAAEREDLATHVDLCAQRYQELDARLNVLETKVDKLTHMIEGFSSNLWKTVIGTGGTILVALIGSVATIVSHIK